MVPERQTEFEVGADLTMLNDRLSLEFTYYNKDVKDLILELGTLSPTTGFNNRLINVGTMTNKGFEFMVKAVPVNTSQFQWVTTFNYTSNDNVVNGVEGNGVLPFAGGFSQVAAVNEALFGRVLYRIRRNQPGWNLFADRRWPATERARRSGA